MRTSILEGLLLSEIAEMTGGSLVGKDKRLYHVSTDSREICENCLFVAIKGENFDGHSFMAEVPAEAFICEYIPGNCGNISAVVVENTVAALGRLAKEYKARFDLLSVAVTGSVGKTTTKEFIHAVLSQHFRTLKTEGNHNNHIGLPMTLLSIDKSTEAAVIELGMSAKGEISYLTDIVRPDIAVITNIGSSHIESLGSREGIAAAKLEIREGMTPDGILIINGDEPLLSGVENAVRVGKSEECDYRITGIVEGDNGCAFNLHAKGETVESIVIPAFGEHNVMNAAFAYAVGKATGMGEYEIRRGLISYKTAGMRQNFYSENGIEIIEDCYNASPESMTASLKVLSGMASRHNKRSVAVLGDMLELGSYSEEAHKKVGAAVSLSEVGLLVTFGKRATDIAKAAADFGMDSDKIFVFEDTENIEALGRFLLQNTNENDIILFKASRGIRLERVIKFIKTEKE